MLFNTLSNNGRMLFIVRFIEVPLQPLTHMPHKHQLQIAEHKPPHQIPKNLTDTQHFNLPVSVDRFHLDLPNEVMCIVSITLTNKLTL